MDYKEKLEEAKRLYETANADQKYVLESLFPELKESEDERIKKEIIEFLLLPHPQFIGKRNHEKWIAWLEKQGDTDKESYEITEKENNVNEETNDPTGYGKYIDECLNGEQILANSTKTCKDEQKPVDKVKPKFKVGDWVVQGRNILKIRCVGVEYYCVETVGGYIDNMLVSEIDSLYHLWTIKDAKDGDVLSDKDEVFIFKYYVLFDKIVYHCCYDGENYIPHNIYALTKDDFKVHPATKEQRYLLFKAMTDAGWEFDFDKKELNRIEQKPAVLSEEEERFLY